MLIALDISSSCIGYSLFDENGKLMELNFVKFKNKHTIFQKLEQFKEETSFFLKFPIKEIAIEEPLKKMQGRYTNAETIAVLNFFNGMISSYLYHSFNVEPHYYNVNHARALAYPGINEGRKGENFDIKHEVWKKVVELEPHINWKYGVRNSKLSEENYDMTDAYTCGVAHMLTKEKQQVK